MAATTLLLLSVAGCGPKGPEHTQVVFITLDTARADYLGCYGNSAVSTPNIDALAADSVVFDNCYSAANSTMPSHTSIFSSLYPKDHGVVENMLNLPDIPGFMPRVFKAAGYNTGAFVSAGFLNPDTSISQGFDTFDFPRLVERPSSETVDAANGWLSNNAGGNFFTWVHFFEPHMYYEPPPPYDSMYTGSGTDKFGVPPKGKIAGDYFKQNQEKLKQWGVLGYLRLSDEPQFYRNMYKGEMSCMDEQVGRLIARLKELGIYDDCTIVLVADHGEMLGEQGIYWDHIGVFEPNVRVPLLIKMPGNKGSGRRAQLVSSLDIYPTLMALTGQKAPGPVRGVGLAGIITDPKAPEVHSEVYSESVYEWHVGIATRDYTYMRLVYNGSTHEVIKDPFGRMELYDARGDIGQEDDILAAHPDVAASMDAKALAFITDRINLPKPVRTADPEQVKKLKALGYVQ